MRQRIACVVVAVALGGCASVGWPVDGGSASPEPDEERSAAHPPTSAPAAAMALIDAWIRGDQEQADQVSNAGAERQLLKRSPPATAPELVSCTEAISMPAAVDCMFAADDGYLVLTAAPDASGAWTVLTVRMRP